MVTSVSTKGIAALNYLEGCPLKAYRDVVGVWTIGAGLTAKSGVVRPKAGMVITQSQADRLLAEALRQNYVPAVVKVMGAAQNSFPVGAKAPPRLLKQHVVDGAVSFHFNTGAIGRASWVKAFLRGDYTGARIKLAAWNKAGGRVLSGLKKRREIEADMMIRGVYPKAVEKVDSLHSLSGVNARPPLDDWARLYALIVVPVDEGQVKQIQDGFERLGYAVRDEEKLRKLGVEEFQRDHDLTIDGLVGRATLSALQRELEARSRSKATVGTGVGGCMAGVGDELSGWADGWASLAGVGVVVVAVGFGLWLVWHYRDVVAARLRPYLPRLAKFLWSF